MDGNTLRISRPPAAADDTLLRVRPLADDLVARYDAARHREAAAREAGDRQGRLAARAEVEAAQAEYGALSRDLGDLLLMLMRHALRWNPDALRDLLAEALRGELEPMMRAAAGRGVRR